jgi:hypothetical protein
MSLSNILLIPGVGGGWWKRSITPKTSEKNATLFMSPWKQSIDDSVPRFIFTNTNGDGYAIRIKNDGLNGIFEGESFGAWYGPKDADRISGISGKTIFADYEYYNLTNSTWTLEYDLTHDFAATKIGIISYQSATNGIIEVYRVRDSVEVLACELDLSGTPQGAEYRSIVDSGIPFENGDTVKLKRKDGSASNCRIHGIVVCSNAAPIGSQAVYIATDSEQVTNSTSSLEWAYNGAPQGLSSSFFGNIAHQTPYTEKNRVFTLTVDSSAKTTQGIYTGIVRVGREADIDYDNTDRLFASYITNYKFVQSGIEIYHKVTFNEISDVFTAHVAMIPTPYSLTTEANAGGIVSVVGGGEITALGQSVTQAQIASTTRGNLIAAVTTSEVKARSESYNSGTGNKIYMYKNLSSLVVYDADEFIEETWYLVLGLKR